MHFPQANVSVVDKCTVGTIGSHWSLVGRLRWKMRQHELYFQRVTQSHEISLDKRETCSKLIVSSDVKLVTLGASMQRHKKLSLSDFRIKIFLSRTNKLMSELAWTKAIMFSTPTHTAKIMLLLLAPQAQLNSSVFIKMSIILSILFQMMISGYTLPSRTVLLSGSLCILRVYRILHIGLTQCVCISHYLYFSQVWLLPHEINNNIKHFCLSASVVKIPRAVSPI